MSPQNQHIIDLTDGNEKDKKKKPPSSHSRNPRIPAPQHQSPQHSESPFASMPETPLSPPPPSHGGPRASSFQHGYRRKSQPHRQHPNRDNTVDYRQGRKRKRNCTHKNASNAQTNSNRNKNHPSQLEQHQHRENYKRQRFGQRPGDHGKHSPSPQSSTKSNSSIWNAVYIEGIPSNFTQDQIHQFLVSHGLRECSIQDMIFPTMQDSGSLLQGSGYVVFKSSASFHQALVLSGLRLGSGHIRVVPAKKLPTVGQPKRVAVASDGPVQMELKTSSNEESEQSAIHPPENNSAEVAEKESEGIRSRKELRGTQGVEQSGVSAKLPRTHNKSAFEINFPLVVDLVSSSDSENELEENMLMKDAVVLGQISTQEPLVSFPRQHCAAASANMVDQLHDTDDPLEVAQLACALIGEETGLAPPIQRLASPPRQPCADKSITTESSQEIAITMEVKIMSEQVHSGTMKPSLVSANGLASSTLQRDVAGSTELGCTFEDDEVLRFGVNPKDEYVNTSSRKPTQFGMAESEVRETGEHDDGEFERVGHFTVPLIPSLIQGDNTRTTELDVHTSEEHMDRNTKRLLEVTAASGSEMNEQLGGNTNNITLPPSQPSVVSLLHDVENMRYIRLRDLLVFDRASELDVSTKEVEKLGLGPPHESPNPHENPFGLVKPTESLSGNRYQEAHIDDNKNTDEKTARVQSLHANTVKFSSPKPTSKRVASSERAINSFLEQVHGFQSKCTETAVDPSVDDDVNNKHRNTMCSSTSSQPDDDITVLKVVSTPSLNPESNTKTRGPRRTNSTTERVPPVKQQRFRPVAPKRTRVPCQTRDKASIPILLSTKSSTTTVFPERRYVIHSTSSRPSVQKRQQKSPDYRSFKFATSEEAQREQDRLLREAASRVRHKAQFHVTQGPSSIQSSNISFSTPIIDINARYPSHWEFKDPYSRLGLPKGADMKLVKAHFRSLARIYHPDKSKTYGTAAKFQAIAEAYHSIIRA